MKNLIVQDCRDSQSGFTLIEVALSMLILGIGMLSLMAVFPAGLKAGKNAADDSAMIEFAEAVFSDYEAQLSQKLYGDAMRYTSDSSFIGSGSSAYYYASKKLDRLNNWITVYQDMPSGTTAKFPRFQARLMENNAGPNSLRRVDLFLVKAGVEPSTSAATGATGRTFTRYFTCYKFE